MNIEGRITGKTRIIGLVGNPVEHSISPQLHNTLSALLGVDLVYVPFKVEQTSLDNAVKGLKAVNVLGFNVTVPYKKEIMKYIDDNTREALLMGAVNTVKNIDGRFYGYNTDAEGFSRSFKEEIGEGFKGKKVAIIGAGGSARAIAVKIAIEGAERISIINRTLSKALDISDFINQNIIENAVGMGSDSKDTKDEIANSEIIINTTSAGMHPDVEALPIDIFEAFTKGQVVYDIIYNPVKTRFLKMSEEKGCRTLNGLGMLFYQGIFAYEIWTGIKLSEDIIKEVYGSFKNILNI